MGLTAANPYDPIDMIVDVEGDGVTFWKTILSLFRDVGTNDFERACLLKRLVGGWKSVAEVCEFKRSA